jgi:hypothetical protein
MRRGAEPARQRAVAIAGLLLLGLAAASLGMRWAQASLPGGEERRLALLLVGAASLCGGLALLLLRRAAAAHLLHLLAACIGCGIALALFVGVDLALGYREWSRAQGDRPLLDGALHRRDPVLGWVPRPGARMRDRYREEFDVEYRIDADGFRGIRRPAPAGRQILFFGDSFTFGSGVGDHETFSAVIARDYADPALGVRNAGVIGYGLVQMYGRLRELERHIRPGDLVVFAPLAVDLWRDLRDFYQLAPLLYDAKTRDQVFPEYRGGSLEGVPLDTPLNRARTLLLTAQFSRRFFRFVNRAVTAPSSLAEAQELVAAARELCLERGADFALTFLPSANEILSGRYDFDVDGFDYVELRRFFPREEEVVRSLHFPRDRHWNARGHAVAARALVAGLLEEGILEPTNLQVGAVERLAPLGVAAGPSARGPGG